MAVLTRRLLANDTIERSAEGELAPSFAGEAAVDARVETVDLSGLSDAELATLSRERVLSLDVDEMRVIQAHFAAEGRPPNDAELETLAQTWSEHCVHKTFRARIELTHTAADGTVTVTEHDGLLPALREVTEELDPWWLRSAFVDDAGIIAFDDDLDLASRSRPTTTRQRLEPFGGANTGIGGVIRDILGVSAPADRQHRRALLRPARPARRPAADGRAAPAPHPRRRRRRHRRLRQQAGHPDRQRRGHLRRGLRRQPAGLLRGRSACSRTARTRPRRGSGDLVVSIGGRTGRDGIHGATFSSAGMDASTVDTVGSAVQIGDPITEKGCIEVVERARDAGLYTAITDCGAGGFSSAVGEMGEELGADVDLDRRAAQVPGPAAVGDLDLRGAGAHGPGRAARQPRRTPGALRRVGRRGDRPRRVHRRPAGSW